MRERVIPLRPRGVRPYCLQPRWAILALNAAQIAISHNSAKPSGAFDTLTRALVYQRLADLRQVQISVSIVTYPAP
jgi:hypothetical protein